ncbi:MAG: D-2-hydroxyacid dehydrogenase [Ruminococcaceae bacterium]|nr:D-2-hydroxyacid dehydrogenase [Oscillospiraceae bacterium]
MKLLVTGAARPDECIFDLLKAKGHDPVFLQNESDELPVSYGDVDGVICNGLFFHHPIEKFTSLRYIQLTSAGFDRVPMDHVRDHNIRIHNAAGVYSIPMAEFAVTAVLGLYKKWDHFRRCQADHSWEKHRGLMELYGKTVCIVGCGNVGTECAKRFGAFGCNVLGVDLYPRDSEYFRKMFPVTELLTAVSCADVVVLTLPLTDETKHIISKTVLDSLKDGCVLVNIARGAIINTECLINALREKGLYAVLDVFEEEPLSAVSPLWDMKNVIITPHNSFVGEGNHERLWRVILDNLKALEHI